MYDFLRLNERRFSGVNLVLFYGTSGSGKSTALTYLREQHVDFKDGKSTLVSGLKLDWSAAWTGATTIFIDEIRAVTELRYVIALCLSGKRVIAATHVHPNWLWPLRYVTRSVVFRTDRSYEKLAVHLTARQVAFSESALVKYCARYGANYTDLDIILERCPNSSFDVAYTHFERFNSLVSEPYIGTGLPNST